MPRYEIDKATGKRVVVEQTVETAPAEKSAATEKKGERK